MTSSRTVRRSLLSLGLGLSLASPAGALVPAPEDPVEPGPRHDICADLPAYFGMGVSSFSDYGPQYIDELNQAGVNWNFVYLYVQPTGNRTDTDFITYVIRPKFEQAKAVGAIPVVTFYDVLNLGWAANLGGSEADVVKAALQDPAVMREYFEDFKYMLQQMNDIGGPFIMHVEPDTWGFMMWAFGIEGNGDATSVDVSVGSSGFEDVAAFEDDAGGFGKALLHLRDLYAPEARMGWHASNFRFNSQPEVVTQFYSSMGEWDLLVGEGGHIPGSNDWWAPLEADAISAHMAWHQDVTTSARLPLLSWQRQIGYTDYHFLNESGDYSLIESYAANGVVGFAFGLETNTENADDAKGTENGYTETPPSGHEAGGTALEMRPRLTAYYQSPVSLPDGSICDGGTNNLRNSGTQYPGGTTSGGTTTGTTTGGGTSTGTTSGGTTSGGTTTGSSTGGDSESGSDGSDGGDESGCSCDLANDRSPKPLNYWWLSLVGFVALRRRGTRRAKVAAEWANRI